MFIAPITMLLLFTLSNAYLNIYVTNAINFVFIFKCIIYVIPESIIVMYLVYILIKNKYYFIGMLISCFFIFVYFIQSLSIIIASDMISVLTIQNYNQMYLLFANQRVKYVLIYFFLLFVIIIYSMYKKFKKTKNFKNTRFYCVIVLIAFFCCYFQNSQLYNICNFKYSHTPIVSLIINIVNATKVLDKNDFTYKDDQYPFLKSVVYKNDNPFDVIIAVKNPNVIVFFFEGLSARIFKEFRGQYPDLTPNMDAFINDSMSVESYYSHTAATFRGIHGQMCSVWPFKGGWMNDKEGWGFEATDLDKRSYSSISYILNNYGYRTVFFSPHVMNDPLTNMLEMLKFESIYYAEKSLAQIGEKPETAMRGDLLLDKYNIISMIRYLQSHEKDKSPFFIGLYNIETHTGVDTQSNGIKYGSGDNAVLNTIHNLDACFGEFYEYFKKSKYTKNTIVILTSDHAHYPDPIYLKSVGNDPHYQPLFVDKIPLYINSKFLKLPSEYKRSITTSASFAPSVLHLLGINNVENNFMELSIFDKKNNKNYGINFIGEFYLITENKIYHESQVPKYWESTFNNEKSRINFFHFCEANARVFPYK